MIRGEYKSDNKDTLNKITISQFNEFLNEGLKYCDEAGMNRDNMIVMVNTCFRKKFENEKLMVPILYDWDIPLDKWYLMDKDTL